MSSISLISGGVNETDGAAKEAEVNEDSVVNCVAKTSGITEGSEEGCLMDVDKEIEKDGSSFVDHNSTLVEEAGNLDADHNSTIDPLSGQIDAEPSTTADQNQEQITAEDDLGPPPIEIAFSFDTTGSMSQCLDEVRAQLRDLIERLFSDIPNLRIAIIAHGDYCDVQHFYVTRHVDFTNDVEELTTFVKDVGGTGGGDWEECYELVLHEARDLDWNKKDRRTQRSLVMIGDAAPHPPTDPQNKKKLNWITEALVLHKHLGVRIYSVQCITEPTKTPFWLDLAKLTNGRHLLLKEFRTIVDIMMAICYREKGVEFFDNFENEVRLREGDGMRPELAGMLDALRDTDNVTASGTGFANAGSFNSSAEEQDSGVASTSGVIANGKTPAKKKLKIPTGAAKAKITPKNKVTKPKVVKKKKQPAVTAVPTLVRKRSAKPLRKATEVARRNLKRAASILLDSSDDDSGIDESDDEDFEPPPLKKAAVVLTATDVAPATAAAAAQLPTTAAADVDGDVTTIANVKTHAKKAAAKVTNYRESMSNSNAPGNALDWTQWQVCISNEEKTTGSWVRRRAGPGMRRTDLFWGHTNVPAIYEFSVRCQNGRKRHVMYMRTTTRLLNRWDNKLLSNIYVRRQIERVLNNGGEVHVRRAIVEKDDMKRVRKSFGACDYAWDPRKRRFSPRKVVRNGEVLAD